MLLVSGLGLRQGLATLLRSNLDRSLLEALALARPLVNEENGHLRLEHPGEEDPALKELPGDLAILLYREGNLVGTLGKLPPAPPSSPQEGCFSQRAWRFCGLKLPGGVLLAGRPLEGIQESLEAMDRVLLWIGPLAFTLTGLLGYLLVGRALAPVRQLTLAAHTRAHTQTWEPLPLPSSQDELRTLAEAFNALFSALLSALERERRFTQDAAHELRTPLTVLLGRLEQAREENRDPRLEPRLAQALKAGQKLLRLVEDLLHLARAEAGQGFKRERLDLSAVMQETVEDISPLFAARGVRLEMELPQELLILWGDPIALAMAVRNLLDNALKFSPQGARVTLSLQRQGGYALLAVEDEGPGFPEEALPYVFQRFYQAKEEHRLQGSGLGLSIVAAIVRWHGGSVSAQNTPRGARVIITLPLVEA